MSLFQLVPATPTRARAQLLRITAPVMTSCWRNTHCTHRGEGGGGLGEVPAFVLSVSTRPSVTHGTKLSWITASRQLLLGENTLHTERGRGGRGDILQLLLILTTGEATYQVRKKRKL